jgi:hypothetical protein
MNTPQTPPVAPDYSDVEPCSIHPTHLEVTLEGLQAAIDRAQRDHSTPGPQNRPSALGAAVTTASAGTPLAIISVLLVENWLGHPLDTLTATAVGSVGGALAGYGFRVAQALLLKAGIDPGP